MPELSTALARNSRAAILVATLVLAILAGGAFWWTQRGLPDDVAVRVADQDVTVTELRERMSTVEALYGVTAPDDEKKQAEFWKDAAKSVAVGLVLADAVEDEDLAITDNDVDQAVQQVVTSFFGQGEDGQAAFAKALGDAGTSEKSVRDELRRQLEINALFAKVTGEVESPTPGEVEAAYAERRCDLLVPEQRRLRNVVVATRGEAEDALRRLSAGDTFASVAAAMSIDASTREVGGDLGDVAAGELEKAYAAAAFAAGKGQLFGPVRSEFGWNVGRVDSISAPRMPSLEETREQLRQTLFTEEQSKVWRSWLRARLKQAEVEYGEKYQPEDPLQLPDNGATGAPTPEPDVDQSATADTDC